MALLRHFANDLLHVGAWLLLLSAIFIPLERLWAVHPQKVFRRAVWGFFIHANLRWRFGPFEWLVSTPAFHHWHHTSDEHLNHNYSTMLPWVDRIFGTHYMPRDHWPPGYGIDDKLPDAIGDQLLYPLLPHKSPLSPQPPPG